MFSTHLCEFILLAHVQEHTLLVLHQVSCSVRAEKLHDDDKGECKTHGTTGRTVRCVGICASFCFSNAPNGAAVWWARKQRGHRIVRTPQRRKKSASSAMWRVQGRGSLTQTRMLSCWAGTRAARPCTRSDRGESAPLSTLQAIASAARQQSPGARLRRARHARSNYRGGKQERAACIHADDVAFADARVKAALRPASIIQGF